METVTVQDKTYIIPYGQFLKYVICNNCKKKFTITKTELKKHTTNIFYCSLKCMFKKRKKKKRFKNYKNKKWRKQEIDFLNKYYLNKTDKEMSKHLLRKSVSAIQMKRYRLGLKKYLL